MGAGTPEYMQSYIPALKYHVLTPLYDVGMRLTFPERRLKTRLLESAAIREGFQILDLGCGTGTLLLLAKRMYPRADLTGVDIDSAILERARRKAQRAGASIRLERASATALPFSDASFHRVLTTLVLHHLDSQGKVGALAEAFRVLRAAGEIHIADFGSPQGFLTRLASWVVEHVGREHVMENVRGMIPGMMAAAGFIHVEETGAIPTVFGMVRMIRGIKP